MFHANVNLQKITSLIRYRTPPHSSFPTRQIKLKHTIYSSNSILDFLEVQGRIIRGDLESFGYNRVNPLTPKLAD